MKTKWKNLLFILVGVLLFFTFNGIKSNAQESDVKLLSSNKYSVEGMDVSYHQGKIDWSAVKGNVDFAILRCANSTLEEDEQWKNNVEGCKKNKIPFGVYIISQAKNTSQASKEADYVLKLIKGYSPSYPIFIDFEQEFVDKYKISSSSLLQITNTFCKKIEKAGYKAGIYTSLALWNSHLTSDTYNQWNRWVGRWNSAISESGYQKTHNFWQYTTKGTVPGIIGNVDKNYLISYVNISKFNTKVKFTARSYTYNGKAKTPSISITGLKKGIDYTVSYNNTNINVGIASITLQGIGSYKGKIVKTFKILPKTQTISLSNSKAKKITIKWNKDTQASGYQIQYAKTQSLKNMVLVKVKGSKTISKTITSLKSKTTYYVRVRSYKTVEGKNIYGAWSTVKKIKCK